MGIDFELKKWSSQNLCSNRAKHASFIFLGIFRLGNIDNPQFSESAIHDKFSQNFHELSKNWEMCSAMIYSHRIFKPLRILFCENKSYVVHKSNITELCLPNKKYITSTLTTHCKILTPFILNQTLPSLSNFTTSSSAIWALMWQGWILHTRC